MIEPTELREHVIIPILKKIDKNSDAAVNLLLGTAAQESALGTHIVQINGPALGIYQMEPTTHDDIWKNYVSYLQSLRVALKRLYCDGFALNSYFMTDCGILIKYPSACEMVGNLYYATAMARIHYLRVPHPLPEADDIDGLAQYWKTYYNTKLGKGTKEEFVKNYKRFKLNKIATQSPDFSHKAV